MREIDEIFIPLKKLHSGNVQQNVDDVVILAVSSLRSDPIQRRKWRRLQEMHTYGAATSPPSLVQQVWWRDRLDQQHDGVVLMVENFCSRASPMCSRRREKWRGSNWPAARVGRERGCAPALPYIGGWVASLAPPPSLGRRPKGEEWGASFPPPSRRVALGFPLGLAS
jgi:hypothetical protein